MIRRIPALTPVLGLLIIGSSASFAQTVKVTPSMPSTALGTSVQFTATVTNLSNPTVKWSAGGAVGGNATAGTISASGLYTAPATMPTQNPVQIVATSLASPSIKATTYVYLLSLGPVITSISPNPLPLGTYTVTIHGTGLLANATVNNGGIQLVTTGVSSTSVSATGWQGPASTATFTVRNPGSIASNALTVPVGYPAATTYTLTVVNGSGGGTYAAGTVVNIKANSAPSGQTFSGWTGAAVGNASSASTTITMPAANTTVTANYSAAATFALTVVNGSGDGTYAAGTVVNIKANAAPSGQTFSGWTGRRWVVRAPPARPSRCRRRTPQ